MRRLPEAQVNDNTTLRAWASDLELAFSSEDEDLTVPSWDNIGTLVTLAGQSLPRSDALRRSFVPHFLRQEAIEMVRSRDAIADTLARFRAIRQQAVDAGLVEIVELIDRVDGYLSRPEPLDHDRAVQAGLDLSCCHDEAPIIAAPQGDGWVVSLNKGTLFIDATGLLSYEPPTFVPDFFGRSQQQRTWRRPTPGES